MLHLSLQHAHINKFMQNRELHWPGTAHLQRIPEECQDHVLQSSFVCPSDNHHGTHRCSVTDRRKTASDCSSSLQHANIRKRLVQSWACPHTNSKCTEAATANCLAHVCRSTLQLLQTRRTDIWSADGVKKDRVVRGQASCMQMRFSQFEQSYTQGMVCNQRTQRHGHADCRCRAHIMPLRCSALAQQAHDLAPA